MDVLRHIMFVALSITKSAQNFFADLNDHICKFQSIFIQNNQISFIFSSFTYLAKITINVSHLSDIIKSYLQCQMLRLSICIIR